MKYIYRYSRDHNGNLSKNKLKVLYENKEICIAQEYGSDTPDTLHMRSIIKVETERVRMFKEIEELKKGYSYQNVYMDAPMSEDPSDVVRMNYDRLCVEYNSAMAARDTAEKELKYKQNNLKKMEDIMLVKFTECLKAKKELDELPNK